MNYFSMGSLSIVSLQFLAFAFIVVLIYYIVPGKLQWVILLLSSYIFYLMGGIIPAVFLLSTTLTTFGAGMWMEQYAADKKKKRRILASLLIINFGILFLLKYYNFLADNLNGIFKIFAYDVQAPLVNILLPLGLSFYTFQSMGYAIDIYRKKIKAERNLARFALFVSFFPQMIQGPISRFDDLGVQLSVIHKLQYINVVHGMQLMLWGFFKKMVIADRLAIPVNTVFENPAAFDGTQNLVAMLGYAIQIYADFSGGIDIVRGLAQMMGINLTENFRRPYFASSVLEYWRRWHISLTEWMRQYVFFPMNFSKAFTKLGRFTRKNFKGRIGKQLPSFVATFIVFLLIGIWHGAGWGNIAFGLYNGIVITLGMILKPSLLKLGHMLKVNMDCFSWKVWLVLRTFIIMVIGKTFARANSVSDAFSMIASCKDAVNPSDIIDRMLALGLSLWDYMMLFMSCAAFFIVSLIQESGIDIRSKLDEQNLVFRWLLYFLLLFSILIFGIYGPGYDVSEFVYRGI